MIQVIWDSTIDVLGNTGLCALFPGRLLSELRQIAQHLFDCDGIVSTPNFSFYMIEVLTVQLALGS